MVERITMDKGNFLGYGDLEDLELVGRAFGHDIYVEKEERTCMTAWVYDRDRDWETSLVHHNSLNHL